MHAKRASSYRLCHEVTDLLPHLHKAVRQARERSSLGLPNEASPQVFSHFFPTIKYYVFALILAAFLRNSFIFYCFLAISWLKHTFLTLFCSMATVGSQCSLAQSLFYVLLYQGGEGFTLLQSQTTDFYIIWTHASK